MYWTSVSSNGFNSCPALEGAAKLPVLLSEVIIFRFFSVVVVKIGLIIRLVMSELEEIIVSFVSAVIKESIIAISKVI